MNEAEIENKPVEDEALLDFNDIKEAEEEEVVLFEEDTEEVSNDTEVSQNSDETESIPAEEVKEEEVDFKPLLDKLSKNIKYMDKEITVESLEDVIEKYQKGLDYDRKTDKIKELENSEEMEYIKSKAKESGMSTQDYIKALKDYEIKQQEQQEETELEEMIENGVAEHIAKKVIETNRLAKELQAERLKLQEAEKTKELQDKKEAENQEFLRNYPDVDIKQIPKEVFADAEKIGLLSAYARYENNKLKKELEVLKQNQNNKESSPIKGTTEHGGVVIEKQDDFLKGLGIE
jgi:hypothetical protein